MSIMPKRGTCLHCGHDHGNGLGSPHLLSVLKANADNVTALEATIADLRAALAQKEAAAPGDLHAAILALPCATTGLRVVDIAPFRLGHKYALKAAAELARAALAQPVAVDAPDDVPIIWYDALNEPLDVGKLYDDVSMLQITGSTQRFGDFTTPLYVLRQPSQAVDVDAPQGWISVHDQMPPQGETVLVYKPNSKFLKVQTDEWEEQHECPVSFSSATVCIGLGWNNHEFEEISHWMPIPAAPVAAIDAQDGEAK